MEENQLVHIVQKSGGCYDEAYHHIIGVWPTFDEAMQQAKDVCLKYVIDESNLPMTFDEYLNCNSGYPDDPWERDLNHEYTEDDDKFLNTRIDRDGHTVDEFEIMDDAWKMSMEDFSSCYIETFVVGVPFDNNENIKLRQSIAYVSNDPNNKGEFLINTY